MSEHYSLDRIALQDVMLNYAAAVDQRERDRYRLCFTDDVEVFNFGEEVYRGVDAWVDYVWNALDGFSATQHLLGPQLATIEGDRASTRSDVQALHFLANDAGRFILWATYLTDMRKEEGRWKISRHELSIRGTSND
jgi:ketosteroid isomerase-like protein